MITAIQQLFHRESQSGGETGAESANREMDLRNGRIRVLVADAWLAKGRIPWSREISSRLAAQRYASAHFRAAGFAVDADDVLRFDDARYRQPALGIAYPTALMQELHAISRVQGTKLESVRPISLAALQWSRKVNPAAIGALAIVEDGAVGFVCSRGDQIHVSSHRIIGSRNEQGDQTEAVANLWRRLRFRDPQFRGETRPHILDLSDSKASLNAEPEAFSRIELIARDDMANLPSLLRLALESRGERHRLDAVESGPPMTPKRWAIAGLALAATAAVVLHAADQTQSATSLRLSSEESSQAQARPALPERLDSARLKLVNAAIREANLPVSSLLKAMHPPQDIQVGLLGIDVSADRAVGDKDDGHESVIKILVEAKTTIDMTRYVAYLSERRPFTGAHLQRHEIVETTPERPYRFTVEATWRE